jgi:hypothetical protein
MKFFKKYGEFDTINSKVISNVDRGFSLQFILYKIFNTEDYQSFRLSSCRKLSLNVGQKWLFIFIVSINIIFLNQVFSQIETKIPLVPSSGEIGSKNERSGSKQLK